MTPDRLAQIRARHKFVGARPYIVGTDHEEIGELLARIEWLESLFDFSDPEVVLHSAPNDGVTKDAVVVLRSHYENCQYLKPGPMAGVPVAPDAAR